MNQVRAKILCIRARNFTDLQDKYERLAGFPNPLTLDKLNEVFNEQLAMGIKECQDIGLPDAETTLKRVLRAVLGMPKLDASALAREALKANDAFMDNLNKQKYICVSQDLAPYIDQERLFGDAVFESFQAARYDIQEAGNCLALGCNTATVFHLMRTAEYGLRALAFDRRISVAKHHQIELATWEEIIKELEKAESAILGFPKTLAREAQYEFYHGAMMEFKRFKNKFRNQVMHTRDSYDEHQASSAFEHVRAFMQILASRIAEGKRTPRVWTGKKWTTACR